MQPAADKNSEGETMKQVEFLNILSKEEDDCTCNLLRIGDAVVMFDCGIDDIATESKINRICDHIESVDLLLLTHSTFRHLGSLPLLYKRGLLDNVTVLATSPVCKFGIIALYEYYLSQRELSDFQLFDLSHVDNAFQQIKATNYFQKRNFRLGETELSVAAFNAGFSVGGAFWKIGYNQQNFLYAIDVNDKNENVSQPLNIGMFTDCHVLITNTYVAPSLDGVHKCPLLQPYISMERLKLHIEKTINASYSQAAVEGRHQGDVLIVCDNLDRVLEILFALEEIAGRRKVHNLPIYYLQHMSMQALEVAKSHIEWMNAKVNKSCYFIDKNPLNFEYIKVVNTDAELQVNAPHIPRVIVTSTSSFLHGFARKILPDFVKKQNNKLIIANKAPGHSITPKLIHG